MTETYLNHSVFPPFLSCENVTLRVIFLRVFFSSYTPSDKLTAKIFTDCGLVFFAV